MIKEAPEARFTTNWTNISIQGDFGLLLFISLLHITLKPGSNYYKQEEFADEMY